MDKYIRHTIMPWFTQRSQSVISRSLVVIVGCGGVGCACSVMLARSGVGRLRIVDGDVVAVTDIHRQILFEEPDAEALGLKAVIAAERLRHANPGVKTEPVVADLDPDNADALVRDADLVVDCSDNFRTRMLVNEVCLKYSKPWIHAACVDTTGMVIPFPVGSPSCYRCIVEHVPVLEPACETTGILGPVAVAVGSIEAAQAIRLLAGHMHSDQRIILFDILSDTWETVKTRGKAGCPACAGHAYPFLDGTESWGDHRVCSGDIVHLRLRRPLDLGAVRDRLSGSAELRDVPGALRIDTQGKTVILPAGKAAIVKGFTDAGAAHDFLGSLVEF